MTDQCTHCSKEISVPIFMTCNHDLCGKCATSVGKESSNERTGPGNVFYHCEECGVGVINQGLGASASAARKKKESNGSSRGRSAHEVPPDYREKRATLLDNLKGLEEDNRELDKFIKRLNGARGRIKHNTAHAKSHISQICDTLVTMIEKRKRSMNAKLDQYQDEKMKELQNQVVSCQSSLETGISAYVRTNKEIQHMAPGAFVKVSENLNETVSNVRVKLPPREQAVDETFDDVSMPNFQELSEMISKMDVHSSGKSTNVTPREGTSPSPTSKEIANGDNGY